MTHARSSDRAAAIGVSAGLSLIVGIGSGLASAVFMFLLNHATEFRLQHPELLYALPVAGLGLGFAFERWGDSIKKGTNLIIDAALGGGKQVPSRLGPMVLVGTVLSHLFGASVGREGTAVQMGGSLADALAQQFKVTHAVRKSLLLAGVAGGFASVFGAPMGGCVFALEFMVVGSLQWSALVPCVIAAVVGWQTFLLTGVHHTVYPQLVDQGFSWSLIAKVALIGIVVGLMSRAFVAALHLSKAQLEKRIVRRSFRTLFGGCVLLFIWFLPQTHEVFGLSTELLLKAFDSTAEIGVWVPWLKLVVTVVAVSSGFIGGEVVPTFVMGATLGHLLGQWLGVPVELAAAVSMLAFFGSASKAPMALSVLGFELFGIHVVSFAVIACVLATLSSGRASLYTSQRRR